MRRLFYLAVTAALIAGLVLQVLTGLADFDLARHEVRDLSFPSAGARLSGTLVLPADQPVRAVALLVHGDGPQDRFSEGGYLPLINALADAGIGTFTWDKPGIGASGGDWLAQSMEDRAAEARAARAWLAGQPELSGVPVGYVGFSQAGWVLPLVARDEAPAFTVLVGGAVNWRDQGAYYGRKRLEAEGWAPDAIDAELDRRRAADEALFGAGTPATPPEGMSAARAGFIARNLRLDSTSSLAGMHGPVLAIWGADDLNVDAMGDSAIYRREWQAAPEGRTVLLVPGATHGLLRHALFGYQLPSDWPAPARWAFLALGRRAYAPGALDTVSDWILALRR